MASAVSGPTPGGKAGGQDEALQVSACAQAFHGQGSGGAQVVEGALDGFPGSVLSEVGAEDDFKGSLGRPPVLRAVGRGEVFVVHAAQALGGVRRVEVTAGLRIAELAEFRLGFVVSHPCARKDAQGWASAKVSLISRLLHGMLPEYPCQACVGVLAGLGAVSALGDQRHRCRV